MIAKKRERDREEEERAVSGLEEHNSAQDLAAAIKRCETALSVRDAEMIKN